MNGLLLRLQWEALQREAHQARGGFSGWRGGTAYTGTCGSSNPALGKATTAGVCGMFETAAALQQAAQTPHV